MSVACGLGWSKQAMSIFAIRSQVLQRNQLAYCSLFHVDVLPRGYFSVHAVQMISITFH